MGGDWENGTKHDDLMMGRSTSNKVKNEKRMEGSFGATRDLSRQMSFFQAYPFIIWVCVTVARLATPSTLWSNRLCSEKEHEKNW